MWAGLGVSVEVGSGVGGGDGTGDGGGMRVGVRVAVAAGGEVGTAVGVGVTVGVRCLTIGEGRGLGVSVGDETGMGAAGEGPSRPKGVMCSIRKAPPREAFAGDLLRWSISPSSKIATVVNRPRA